MVAIPFYSILSSALCLWASSAEAFLCPFTFFLPKVWWDEIIVLPLHPQSEKRAFSSVGLEHLPYKQRVGGSNPSTPTSKRFVFGNRFSMLLLKTFAIDVQCIAWLLTGRQCVGLVLYASAMQKRSVLYLRSPFLPCFLSFFLFNYLFHYTFIRCRNKLVILQNRI